MIRQNSIVRLEHSGGTLYFPNTGKYLTLPSLDLQILKACEQRSIFNVRRDLTSLFPNIEPRDFDNAAVGLTALNLFTEQGLFQGQFLPYTPLTNTSAIHGPLNIFVEITQRCNLSCAYCFNDKVEKFIDLRTFSRLVEQSEQLGIMSFSITGGEPTLHPEFDLFLKHLDQSKMQPRLITNALNLDPIERNVDTLKRYTIIISLHFQENKNVSSRYFHKIFYNIDQIIRKKIHVVVNLLIPSYQSNINHYLLNTLNQLRQINVKEVNVIHPRIPAALIDTEDGLRLQEFEQHISETLESSIHTPHFDLRQKSAFCDCNWRRSFGVLSHGDVVTCGIAKKPQAVGNIFKEDLIDIATTKLPNFY